MRLKNLGIIILKVVVVLAVYFFIFFKIAKSPDIREIPLILSMWGIKELCVMLAIIIFMLINWSVETFKWQKILPDNMRMNFINSLRAVFAGIAVGNLTPNRIGEFGGRILFIESGKRKKAAAYTIIADISQFIVTISIGVCAFFILGYGVIEEAANSRAYASIVLIIGILISLFSILFYFNMNIIPGFLGKIRYFSKYKTSMNEITGIGKAKLAGILGLSAIRFIIFIFQFYLMLNIFDIEISLINTFLAVSNIYLATTIIPNIPFSELGIRSAFSIVFLGLFSPSVTAIVLASIAVFIINIAIPSLIGSVWLYRLKK